MNTLHTPAAAPSDDAVPGKRRFVHLLRAHPEDRRLTVLVVAVALVSAAILALTLGHSKPSQAGGDYAFYLGTSGVLWPSDHGVLSGGCDAVGVRGHAAAGVPSAQFAGGILPAGDSDDAVAAMGADDRACLGQALELATGARGIAWHNPYTNISYHVVPLEKSVNGGQTCRRFVLEAPGEHSIATACTAGDGVWSLARHDAGDGIGI